MKHEILQSCVSGSRLFGAGTGEARRDVRGVSDEEGHCSSARSVHILCCLNFNIYI